MRRRARSGSAAHACATGKISAATTLFTTDPLPGDRSPRSPRNANALGFQSGGVLFWSFGKRVFCHSILKRARAIATRTVSRCRFSGRHRLRSILHRTFGHRGPRTGRAATEFHHEARKCCAAMLGAGGGRFLQDTWHAHGLALRRGANAKHRSNGVQRYGLASHPVRAALPWRMPDAGRRCFAMTVAQSGRAANESSQVAGSIPARQPLDSSDG